MYRCCISVQNHLTILDRFRHIFLVLSVMLLRISRFLSPICCLPAGSHRCSSQPVWTSICNAFITPPRPSRLSSLSRLSSSSIVPRKGATFTEDSAHEYRESDTRSGGNLLRSTLNLLKIYLDFSSAASRSLIPPRLSSPSRLSSLSISPLLRRHIY